MATELQNELYHKNKQLEYLAQLMAQEIYPRMIDALKKLGMEEVRFDGDFNKWKDFCIKITGKLQFYSLTGEKSDTKKSTYELDFSGQNECPLFKKDDNTGTAIFESSFPKYKSYCEVVINKLEELEKNFIDANELITRIEKMGVLLERNVLTEKTNGEKS